MKEERYSELLGVFFLAAAMLIFLSLVTYDAGDLSYLVSTPNEHLSNIIGIIGACLAGGLFFLMGLAGFIIPVLTLFWAVAKFLRHKPQRFIFKLIGSAVFVLSASGLASIGAGGDGVAAFKNGGLIGFTVSGFLSRYFGNIGSFVIAISLMVLSLLVATDFLVVPFAKNIYKGVLTLLKKCKGLLERRKMAFRVRKREKAAVVTARKAEPKVEVKPALKPAPRQEPLFKPKPKVEKAVPEVRPRPEPKKEDGQPKKPLPLEVLRSSKEKPQPKQPYQLPSLDLLKSPPPLEERRIDEDLKTNSEVLEGTLRDFGIEAKVVQVNQGPVITRYEIEPATGVKVSRITVLSDDIARAMKAQSIRIVAPVPGKATVGVEVPNTQSAMVYLRELLESDEFKGADSKLMLALGKSIAGRSVITDLSDMPHLLIAGTTGSGKTVCVNCLIMSLLFHASPEELKFLMVDPKMVELAMFNGLPHLICPVVTEPKKVSGALNWVVSEMENRFKIFAELSVRNIDIYNEKLKAGKFDQSRGLMPYIVVIIDELADLMLVSQVDIESAITRLAQLSRAVGIHIVLATQRPSVDVITGVIKANFPARISFKVATKVDSRTVLDMNGADKLLGKGDMLFLEPGTEKPIRAQGGLVADSEMEKVIDFIKSQRGPDYNEDVLTVQKKHSGKTFEKDEVYDESVRLVLQGRQASVSMIQRKMGLGYTRAARLIDMMEEEGIVGPYQGSKPRDILVENPEEIQKEE